MFGRNLTYVCFYDVSQFKGKNIKTGGFAILHLHSRQVGWLNVTEGEMSKCSTKRKVPRQATNHLKQRLYHPMLNPPNAQNQHDTHHTAKNAPDVRWSTSGV